MDEYSEQCGLQQSRRLLGRQEFSQLARFVQISEGLDADGLIDAADADGAKSTRLDELCDSRCRRPDRRFHSYGSCAALQSAAGDPHRVVVAHRYQSLNSGKSYNRVLFMIDRACANLDDDAFAHYLHSEGSEK
jgi:hypothetical protein